MWKPTLILIVVFAALVKQSSGAVGKNRPPIPGPQPLKRHGPVWPGRKPKLLPRRPAILTSQDRLKHLKEYPKYGEEHDKKLKESTGVLFGTENGLQWTLSVLCGIIGAVVFVCTLIVTCGAGAVLGYKLTTRITKPDLSKSGIAYQDDLQFQP